MTCEVSLLRTIERLRSEISRLRADLKTQAALTGEPQEALDKALKEIDAIRLDAFATKTQLEQTRTDMAELRAALMDYADEENWHCCASAEGHDCSKGKCDLGEWAGEYEGPDIARRALEGK